MATTISFSRRLVTSRILGNSLLCLLIIIVTLLVISYVYGFWTIQFVHDVGPLSEKYGSFIIKARLPEFLLTHKNRESLTDLLKQLPAINVSDISQIARPDCQQLIEWNKTAIALALVYQQNEAFPRIPDAQYPLLTADCTKFINEKQYITEPVTKEEGEFPIAFSILIYKDIEQFERLLRIIYRPQNYYCIHIDLKSSQSVHYGARSIARCFKNVFIASKLVNVHWGSFSVLEAELICMNDLWKYKKWKYFINLTGLEFPLQTNLDIVKILKIFHGANNMEGTVLRRNNERISYVYNMTQGTSVRKRPPPVPVTLTKGSVHITASRAFVDYVLHDSRALKFREWVKDTGVPDETFFSSLNHSPQLEVPGAYKGYPETDGDNYPFLTRFKNWGSKPFDYACYGLRVRNVCVFGVADLKLLSERREMFANKFHLNFQPLAYECMEELIRNRTRDQARGVLAFDSTLYENFDFIHNHV